MFDSGGKVRLIDIDEDILRRRFEGYRTRRIKQHRELSKDLYYRPTVYLLYKN